MNENATLPPHALPTAGPADAALELARAPLDPIPVPPGALQSTLLPTAAGKRTRNGKIARLRRRERDMVNRMLFENLPCQKIVDALYNCGIKVTRRNISNWKTRGGYREWCLASNHALQMHLYQDRLLDWFRRKEAPELSEVGLQAAATQLSRFFLSAAAAELLASNPEEYERRVSILKSVSGHLKTLQQYHDAHP